MTERATQYTNIFVGGPHGVDIVELRSSDDPHSNFQISRDWGSDVIEVSSSLRSAAIGEVGVRFDRKDGTAIAVLDGTTWRPPTPADQRAVAAARSRCTIVENLLSPLRERSDGRSNTMVAVLAWFDEIRD